jgi:menaquinone-dependent protoporphyrinogen oxidase
MKTLILYATKYGSTEKIAKLLAEKIPNCTIQNVKKDNKINWDEWDSIILGGSIYVGKMQKKITLFCQENEAKILAKKVGLFTCAMNIEAHSQKEWEQFFSKKLVDNCNVMMCLGGEFQFDKMNFVEKAIVKKVAKISQSTSKIDLNAIEEFSKKM